MTPTRKNCGLIAAVLTVASLVPGLHAQTNAAPHVWIATWGPSQQIPEPQNTLSPADLTDTTLRQIVHLSVGGSELRVHLSNAFGTEPLHLTSVHIAKPLAPDSSSIDPQTDRALTFAGAPDVTIPAGAEFISDPIAVTVPPLSDLAISFHLDAPPARETSHPGSRATSWYVHGDAVSAPTLPNPSKVDHWFQLSEIDVEAPPGAASIVALGDSITDGHAATTNGNDRWTDVLAARLQHSPTTRAIGVSNQGIGGNHLLTDGLGPNALARFDRDVLAPAGVRWVILLEGVNDLGGLTRDRGGVLRKTCGPGAAHPRRLPANHHARPCAWPQRLRRDHHAIRRLGLLPSRPAQRSGSPGRQRVDPHPGPLRRSHRLRSRPSRPASPRSTSTRLR